MTEQALDHKVAEALGWHQGDYGFWHDAKERWTISYSSFTPSLDIDRCFWYIIPFATKEGYRLALRQLQKTWVAYFDLQAEQRAGETCEHENYATAICLAFLGRKGKP